MAMLNNTALENEDKMFGPLTFQETLFDPALKEAIEEATCLLCHSNFNLKLSLPIFLAHLFEVHNIIIDEVQEIKNLPQYINYWRDKFKCNEIEQIIPCVEIDVNGIKKNFLVLSNLLEEDKILRHKLKLEHALKVQEFEREDENFIRDCLFCRLHFKGSRIQYLDHLSSQHNLQLGCPQNLVLIEEFVDKIDQKLQQLQCIFCEKTFPDRNTLKEHMRKKLHKRVNPQNKEYDKFYIINYLEPDKSWQALEKEDDKSVTKDDNNDEEYFDWNEKEYQINCLFCEQKETNLASLCQHMQQKHNFDFVRLTKDLDFYQKIKLVNFLRKQMHNQKCIYCGRLFESKAALLGHLDTEKHYLLPNLKEFDQPEYYFPTYENDTLLYLIDDVEELND